MGRKYDLIVFDWDGTLMDSAAAIVDSIQAACRDLELAVPSDAQARHIIGLGLHDALRHIQPDLPTERYPQLADRYRFHYLARDHELRLFAGAGEMIRALADAGFLLAVATGKSRGGLDRALVVSGVGDLFDASRCADECFSKPHPQMLHELMEELSAAPDGTLMIGDTTHDLLMARNAGIAALAVTHGAHPRAALEAEAPLACVDDVAGMHAWLMTNA